jgi:hypothetical protein
MRIKKLHSVSRMQSDSDLKMLNPTGSSPDPKRYICFRSHTCSLLILDDNIRTLCQKKKGRKELKNQVFVRIFNIPLTNFAKSV